MKKNDKDELIEKDAKLEPEIVEKKPRKSVTKRIEKTTKKALKKLDNDIVTRNYDFNLLEVVIIILITGVVVSIASGLIVYNNYANLFEDGECTKNELKDDDFALFKENYNKIVNTYVGDVNKEELLDAAINGMYDYLGDDYSVYMDQNTTQDLDEQLNGQYTGIGIEIVSYYLEEGKTDIIINRVFKDTPAEEAGLLPGDKIIGLNGVSLEDKDGEYVSTTIKNSDQATHTLKVLREDKEIELTLTRKLVYIESVTGEVIDGVGYIKIDTFSATTVDQVTKYIDSFDNSVKSLVIDVRDNTGGYLTTAYGLGDLFIEKGKNIYQMKEKSGEVITTAAENGVYRKFDKIAVLINQNSASASEVLALALKESAGATIVGTKSFGKGSVQETHYLPNGAMAKITVAYWLSPNGNSINLKGIEPDILVEDVDKQISEAIKAVK